MTLCQDRGESWRRFSVKVVIIWLFSVKVKRDLIFRVVWSENMYP